jgi:hypothetical protein
MSQSNRLTVRVRLALVLALGCLPLAALAQRNIPIVPFSQIAGAPTPVQRNLPAGYYIRRGLEKADDEIVLVTHGLNGDKTRGIVFTGTVTVDGPILNPHAVLLEKEHKEGFQVKGNTIEFRLLTYGDIDAFAFRAPRAQQVTFTLYADGRPVQGAAFGGKPEWVNGNVITVNLTQ